MKVSVSIITYNHAPFIAQAIESVLAQETDFEYEVLIGEDDSTDGTREIVLAYRERYPDRIRLFLNDRKNVIYINGRPTGRWNFINNLKHTQGQYVALLEGDDYWTSPHKLQKQVNFLDAHPECALCFHQAEKRYEGVDRPKKITPPSYRPFYTLEDLLERNFIRTCTVMFRNGLFGDFPAWFYTTPMGDWPLHILNAQHGKIGYLDETMAVLRVHKGGTWSPRRAAERSREAIQALKTFRRHLPPRYAPLIEQSIARWYIRLLWGLVLNRQYRQALSALVKMWTDDDLTRSRVIRTLYWAVQRKARGQPWITA